MIRSELNDLIGAQIIDLKCRVFVRKSGPFPMVWVFRVVRPIATVRCWVEWYPEPTQELKPIVHTTNGEPLVWIPMGNADLIDLEWTGEERAHLKTLGGEVHFLGCFWSMEGL
jgi:hypothetical protein